MTREQWLNRLVTALRPRFKTAGAPIPKNVRVSVGFPSHGALGKSIGECWSDTCSKDGTFEIFVSPRMGTAAEAGPVLAHELVHAAVGLAAKHGAAFAKVFYRVGLEGKVTQCAAGPELTAFLARAAERIGPFPHAALDKMSSNAPKQQKGRMVKASCPECGYTVRTTRKWLDDVGAPLCPHHGQMVEG